MNARCPCTMLKVDDGKWVKPEDGYLEPDPNCEECKGEGFIPVKFDLEDDDIEAVWCGICSECGRENGGCIQFKGEPPPSLKARHQCTNDDCPNEFCEWEK